jgi:DNA polymerase-3 subunit chi
VTAACQVDFYVLQDPSLSAEKLACRLALMAWEQGNRIMVLASDRPQVERLDALMWEYPAGRFLPHAQAGRQPAAPVTIGTMAELVADAGDVIINLAEEAVPGPERYRRLLEFVPCNEARRQASRDKFRIYRDAGLAPASHPINTAT